MAALRIGEAASRAGISTATIRYYERVELMPRAPRSAGGYRLYSERALQELKFIRRAQALGFSLEETRGLLRLSRNGEAPCSRVMSLAAHHLTVLDKRIEQLRAFRQRLADALDRWRADRCEFASDELCDLLGSTDPVFDPAGLTGLRQPPRRRASGTVPRRPIPR